MIRVCLFLVQSVMRRCLVLGERPVALLLPVGHLLNHSITLFCCTKAYSDQTQQSVHSAVDLRQCRDSIFSISAETQLSTAVRSCLKIFNQSGLEPTKKFSTNLCYTHFKAFKLAAPNTSKRSVYLGSKFYFRIISRQL